MGNLTELARGRVQELASWAASNKSTVLWGVAAVGAGIAALAYYNAKNRPDEGLGWEYLQALYSYASGDSATALPIFRALAAEGKDQSSVNALYYLGRNAYQTGDTQSAEQYLTSFISRKPKEPVLAAGALGVLGSIALDREQYDEAARNFKQAAELSPYVSYRGYFILRQARALQLKGDMQEALAIYSEIAQGKEYEKSSLKEEAEEEARYIRALLAARGSG